jgi:outer membrane lipoprotein carrier protein
MFAKAILALIASLNVPISPLPQKAADAATQIAPKAPAKPMPSAVEVVAGVQAYYKNTTRLEATFRQRYTNTVFGKTSQSDGKLYLDKPGKMRWDYKTPDKKLYISDGTLLWVVDFANKQAFKQKIEDQLLPVAVTFLYGQGDLAKDFTPTLDAGKFGGKNDWVVKLTPKTPSAQYKTLWLVVDPADYHVKESIIQEASDNLNAFAFGNIRLNDAAKNVKPSVFKVAEGELRKQGLKIIEKIGPQAAPGAQPAK